MAIGVIILLLFFMNWGFKNARLKQEEGNGTIGVLISLGTMSAAVLMFLIVLPVLVYYNETPH